MSRQFQFVAVANPTVAPSSEAKSLAYSHAFRQAHAQRRREKAAKYRKERARVPSSKSIDASVVAVSRPLSHVLSGNADPFASFSRPLSPLERSLLHHYVHVIVPFTMGHCGLFDHPGDSEIILLQQWVSLAVQDGVLMVAAILLGTCRHILQYQPDNSTFVHLALQYKQICLQALRLEMSTTVANALTVAKALALVIDEVAACEYENARKHLKGVVAMVDASGGATELGLAGLVNRMYQRFRVALDLEGPELNLLCTRTTTQG